MADDPVPRLVYEPAPCPRCGATTYTEAGDICRPSRDVTGEAWCPGGEEDWDGDDLIRQPTAESIALEAAWYKRAGDALFGENGGTAT